MTEGIAPGAFVVERDGERKVLYEPLPHQAEFHAATERYVILEGSRGGGKSICLRWHAYMQCLMIPRFRALLVRRSMPELRSSHLQHVIFEAEKMGLPRDAWHATHNQLRFPNHSTLTFSHVEDEATLTKLLSSEYELILADETSTLTERIYGFLLTSLRSPIPGYIPKFRGATNPIGPFAAGLKALYLEKNPDPDKYADYDPNEHRAIHCNLTDNKYINPAEYARVFASLPSKALRAALQFGSWDAVEGQYFTEFQAEKDGKPWHVIPDLPRYKGRPMTTAPGIEVFRSIDFGYVDDGCALTFLAMYDGSLIVFDEFVFNNMLPTEVAEEMKRRAAGLKVRYTAADPAMFAQHEGPAIAEHFERVGVPLIEADRQRKPGWIEVHNRLRETVNDGTGARPRLQITANCKYLIRTIPAMVTDEKDPEDIVTRGVEDHGVDALRYGLMSRPSASRIVKTDPENAYLFRDLIAKPRRRSTLGSEARHR